MSDAETGGTEVPPDDEWVEPAPAFDTDSDGSLTISTHETGQTSQLGHEATRSFRWSIAGQFLSRVGVFATGIVLARTLTPHDFGVYAVALAAFSLLMMVNEVGMVTGIVRASDEELHDAVKTGATVAFGVSLTVASCAFVAAPWFASALGTQEATGILRLLVVSVVIDGAMTVPMALLARSFQQNRIAIAEAVGLLVYMVAAIGLATAGAGPWSIAIGRVASTVVIAGFLMWFCPSIPRPGYNRVEARKLFKFGLPLTLAALVAEAVLNVDYLVVGKVLGAASLGIYLLAFNLSTWPVSAVLVAIGRVAFPAFARLAHDRERMASAFERSVGLIATAVIPFAVLLATLSTDAIATLYGDRWLPAAVPLRFLLVLAVSRVVIQTTLELIAAQGKSVTLLKVQTAWLVMLIPVLVIGANRYGTAGVGFGHMVVVVLWVAPILAFALRRAGVSLGAIGRQFIRPLIGAAGAVVAVEATLQVVNGALARLVVGGLAGFVVYLALVVPFNPLVAWGYRQARGGSRDPIALANA